MLISKFPGNEVQITFLSDGENSELSALIRAVEHYAEHCNVARGVRGGPSHGRALMVNDHPILQELLQELA